MPMKWKAEVKSWKGRLYQGKRDRKIDVDFVDLGMKRRKEGKRERERHQMKTIEYGEVSNSVTRFAVILPLWQNQLDLWQFLRVYFLFGILLNLSWQILYVIGQIFIDENGQKLKNILVIWSHWSATT